MHGWLGGLSEKTHVAMAQPGSGVVAHHICIIGAAGEEAELVGESARGVQHHAMPAAKIALSRAT